METVRRMSLTTGVAWAIAAIPPVTLLVFIVYGLSARSVFGYWPVIYRDNVPPSLRLMDQIASASLLIWFWSAVVGLIAAVLLWIRSFRLRFWRSVLTFWIGVILFYATVWIDPFGFIDWFLD